jgi:DNA polymerase V
VFAGIDDERRLRAMYAVDEINRRHGRHSVRPLSLGAGRGWDMRRQKVSPRYTTRIDDTYHS